ncbi:MAG: M4 family metallopeptidase [Bacteriovoracales bacterium]|nr:M4 family metallopeptidase [Bacteriovoracales bacterium]
MDFKRFFLLIFLVPGPTLHGFLMTPNSHSFHKNMLRNERFQKVYVGEIQKNAKAFKDVKRLRKYLDQRRVVKRRQTYRDVPIFGSRVIDLYLGSCKNCKVAQMGRKARLYGMGIVPFVPLENSIDIAQEEMAKSFSQERSKLIIYPTEKENHLAWMMEEDSQIGRSVVFVDAKKGEVIDYYDNIAYLDESAREEVQGEGLGLFGRGHVFNVTFDGSLFQMLAINPPTETYRYKRGVRMPGSRGVSSLPVFNDPGTVDAHSYAQKYLRLLSERFGRWSFDNEGSPIISTVGYQKVSGRPFLNAFWNGRQMVYGDGDGVKFLPLSGSLDISVHEITHAIMENTSGLIYRGESGALNEAFSDIMAAYAEFKLDPENADWKIGEDVWTPEIIGDAVRYMDNPTRDGRSFDHYEDRYQGAADNGGVHRNSGIANLAFYLLVNGGKHPRRPTHRVEGIGLEKSIDIFYKAFTELLAPSSKFIGARNATVWVAREYDRRTVLSVMEAWAAVGVGRVEAQEINNPNSPPGTGGNHSDMESKKLHVNVDIPDNDEAGVRSTLSMEAHVRELSIAVTIVHSFRGDLLVKAISPRSQTYILHRRKGGKMNDLRETFPIKLLDSDHSVGNWTIVVSDHGKKDTGRFLNWKILWRK